jgi:acetate kinase
MAERIGQEGSEFPDHRAAMRSLFPEGSINEIDAIGHRVVHGGEKFKGPTLVDKSVVKEISELAKFAPLHCHPNVIGIEVMQELLPGCSQCGGF